MDKLCRCRWCNCKNPIYVAYHDAEWGVPQHDDRKLFELLLLESFQAGLSWEIILNKRDAFREAFDDFAPDKISAYHEDKVKLLMTNPSIVRNRRKIDAAIQNASTFLRIQKEWGSFDRYIWHFTDGMSVMESGVTHSQLSDKISEDLKRYGMKFVGTTIIYSYLQAIGVIDGHEEGCYLHKKPVQL